MTVFVGRFIAWSRLAPLLAMLMLTTTARGDTVILSSDDGAGRQRRTGEIVDYTGAGLVLRSAGGRETTIPARNVIEVQTQWSDGQRRGDAALAAADFAAAHDHYVRAVRDAQEKRPWAQRRLLALIINCKQALGQHDKASEYFIRLVRDDPQTPLLACIPLAWLPGQAVEPGLATTWSTDKLPSVRLLGASYLLAGPGRAAAAGVLQRLVKEAESPVAQLAEAQLWRTQVATATASDVDRWSTALQRLPIALRAGPYLIVGRGLAAHDRHLAAALALMRLPINYPDEPQLAAEALLAAARALVAHGTPNDAARLYQEVIDRHPSSAAAAEAGQRLAALQKGSE